MRLSFNDSNVNSRFSRERGIEMFHEAGFDCIDSSYFDEQYYSPETHSEKYQNYLKQLRAQAESLGMCYNQAHAPFPTSVENPFRTREISDDVVRAMRNAATLGAKIIVVHPMQHLDYNEPGNPEKLFEMNMAFYRSLEPYCREFGIKVALENMWQRPVGKKILHSTCSRPEEFIRYLDTLNSEWFVACLDLGHACLVCEDPAEFIRKLGGKRLQALHVHDVDGIDDTHTLPFYGVINWPEVMKALKDIGYQGDFTYECAGFFARQPKELILPTMKHMAEVGRYLISLAE